MTATPVRQVSGFGGLSTPVPTAPVSPPRKGRLLGECLTTTDHKKIGTL